MQAVGGGSGSDSLTVSSDPVAVISTHILAGLQVHQVQCAKSSEFSCAFECSMMYMYPATHAAACAESLEEMAKSQLQLVPTTADPGDAADSESRWLAVPHVCHDPAY